MSAASLDLGVNDHSISLCAAPANRGESGLPVGYFHAGSSGMLSTHSSQPNWQWNLREQQEIASGPGLCLEGRLP